MHNSFYKEFMNGNIKFNDINKYIESWHNDKENHIPLAEYLGFSKDQYDKFLNNPMSLEVELERSRNG